jgi:NADH-quinone oxidoreductase subunit G
VPQHLLKLRLSISQKILNNTFKKSVVLTHKPLFTKACTGFYLAVIYIENKPYEIKEGQNFLHVALSLGFDVPYFCWHPELGSIGACRQCAVQQMKDGNDTKGRTVMACMTPATEGTCFSIGHPEAKAFRERVIEWLMTNHPHDCPICDEGGECHLQDMTVMVGHRDRRFRFKKRTFRNQHLGPLVHHEMNRCITCYRCVRFYKDYAGGTDLGSFQSSNRVYFGRNEEGTLESHFSGNLVEVCPTGVFTDKVYRKTYTRKWDLESAPSICQLCSVGCNISVGERLGTLRRVHNRFNRDINGYFLCDRGRFGHHFVNSERRLVAPQVLRAVVTASDALGHAESILKSSRRTLGIGSPRASLESNRALMKLVGEDNFINGMAASESEIVSLMLEHLQDTRILAPTVHDMETADAVLILGEDISSTAPRMELAIRQTRYAKLQQEAKALGIPDWQDAAVRTLLREMKAPVAMVTPTQAPLDDIATRVVRATPAQIAHLARAVRALIVGESLPFDLSSELHEEAKYLAAWLGGAKKPLIVSGASLGTMALIDQAARLAIALSRKEQGTRLAFAFPEANSAGVALLTPSHLGKALEQLGGGKIDAVIVLENDLSRRLTASEKELFHRHAPKLIVLDTFETSVTHHADVVLPSAPFSETTGTVVNYEGRAQRFYRAVPPRSESREAYHWLRELSALGGRQALSKSAAEFLLDLADEIPVFGALKKLAVESHLRIVHQRIPRAPQGLSGRTAIYAGHTMHEPAPPVDDDSPLSQSMEGSPLRPPASLLPFVWSPKWNSNQAVNKYQSEVGEELKNDHVGVLLFSSWSPDPSKKSERLELALPALDPISRWCILPLPAVFGSDEQSMLCEHIAARSQASHAVLSENDAGLLNIKNKSFVIIEIEGERHEVQAVIRKEHCDGLVGIPWQIKPFGHMKPLTPCEVHASQAVNP